MTGTPYTGDLSRPDMQVLAEHAMRANRIIEFGAGASTQIICRRASPLSVFYCIETDPTWLDRTMENLRRLGARFPVFTTWDGWLSLNVDSVDLIFNDGRADLRLDFAMRAWPMLGEGGSLLWHDCRGHDTIELILDLVRLHFAEVESLTLSASGSNMAVIKKRIVLPYENWNENERLRNGHVATNPAHVGMTEGELLSLRWRMETT